MPSYYRVQCLTCGYDEVRYRNIKKCPTCGDLLERVWVKCICYHGTNKKAAEFILNEGFKPDTWFARHLEDAISYGGNHIFEVMFKVKGLPPNWQFRNLERVSVSRIVAYYIVDKVTIFSNEKLREEICLSNELET